MKQLLKVTIMLGILVIATRAEYNGWFGFGKKSAQQISQADRDLASAIEAGSIEATNNAIRNGAHPNAKVDGHTSLFIHAFEHAINRNWQGNNKITGIHPDRSDIARLVAATPPGGNIDDLNKVLEDYYVDAENKPRRELFVNEQVLQDFALFLYHLHNLAVGAAQNR
jgi:hypothetical protein